MKSPVSGLGFRVLARHSAIGSEVIIRACQKHKGLVFEHKP